MGQPFCIFHDINSKSLRDHHGWYISLTLNDLKVTGIFIAASLAPGLPPVSLLKPKHIFNMANQSSIRCRFYGSECEETEDHDLIQILTRNMAHVTGFEMFSIQSRHINRNTHPIILFVSSLVELNTWYLTSQLQISCKKSRSFISLSLGKNEVDQIDTVSCMFCPESSGASVTTKQVRYGGWAKIQRNSWDALILFNSLYICL